MFLQGKLDIHWNKFITHPGCFLGGAAPTSVTQELKCALITMRGNNEPSAYVNESQALKEAVSQKNSPHSRGFEVSLVTITCESQNKY